MTEVEFALRLQFAVDRLTRTTKQLVTDTDGRQKVLDAPPLLAELRAELMPSGEPSNGSGSSAPGVPVALDLLVLMTDIEAEVSRTYWLVKDATRRPGFGGYTLEDRIRYTVKRAVELGRASELCSEFPRWVDRIERAFDPPKVVPLPGHACPYCKRATTKVESDPGEFVTQDALSVTFGRPMVGRCSGCGAIWSGPKMVELAAMLGGDTQVMQHLLGSASLKRVS